MVGPLEASWKAITDTLAPVVTTVSSVAEKAGDTVVTAARTTVLAKRDVDKQGTPLRDGIRAARESWNAAVRAADGAATSAARETNEFATLAKARTAPLAPCYTAVHDTYVARPEALVTGVALVPFVATLPFSRSLAVKNGAVAALHVEEAAAAAVCEPGQADRAHAQSTAKCTPCCCTGATLNSSHHALKHLPEAIHHTIRSRFVTTAGDAHSKM